MLETIEIKWDLLGAKLATLSDQEQAAFFTGFAAELASYDSQYSREVQMFHVRNKMKPQLIKVLEECLSCLWFEEVKP